MTAQVAEVLTDLLQFGRSGCTLQEDGGGGGRIYVDLKRRRCVLGEDNCIHVGHAGHHITPVAGRALGGGLSM